MLEELKLRTQSAYEKLDVVFQLAAPGTVLIVITIIVGTSWLKPTMSWLVGIFPHWLVFGFLMLLFVSMCLFGAAMPFLVTYFLFRCSLVVSLKLLAIMKQHRSLLLVLVLLGVDLMMAKIISDCSNGLSTGLVENFVRDFLPGIAPYNHHLITSLGTMIFGLAFLPTGIHLGVSFFFLLNKTFDRFFQPGLQLLILRITETKRGVLSQLAIGAAVIAKAIQETMKLL